MTSGPARRARASRPVAHSGRRVGMRTLIVYYGTRTRAACVMHRSSPKTSLRVYRPRDVVFDRWHCATASLSLKIEGIKVTRTAILYNKLAADEVRRGHPDALRDAAGGRAARRADTTRRRRIRALAAAPGRSERGFVGSCACSARRARALLTQNKPPAPRGRLDMIEQPRGAGGWRWCAQRTCVFSDAAT